MGCCRLSPLSTAIITTTQPKPLRHVCIIEGSHVDLMPSRDLLSRVIINEGKALDISITLNVVIFFHGAMCLDVYCMQYAEYMGSRLDIGLEAVEGWSQTEASCTWDACDDCSFSWLLAILNVTRSFIPTSGPPTIPEIGMQKKNFPVSDPIPCTPYIPGQISG